MPEPLTYLMDLRDRLAQCQRRLTALGDSLGDAPSIDDTLSLLSLCEQRIEAEIRQCILDIQEGLSHA